MCTLCRLRELRSVICGYFTKNMESHENLLGSFQGAFNQLAAHDLGAVVIGEVVKRAQLQPKDIDEVILGQSLQAGQGQNPVRQASLKAGLPNETPAYGINMLCGSGLKSIALGAQAIKCGDSSKSVK